MQIKVPSASGWLCGKENLPQPVRNTIQIWIVTGQPCKISALVPQTTERSLVWQLLLLKSELACVHRSFGEETTGGVRKCWLFSQAALTSVLKHQKMVRKDKKDLKKSINGHLCKVDTSGTNQGKFQ